MDRITSRRRLIAVAATTATLAGAALVGAGSAGAVTPPPGGQYHALTASRVLDTRTTTGPVVGGGTVALHILGHGGVPASAVSAVSLHLTAIAGGGGGYVTAWPAGAARPTASSLNFAGGQIISNSVVVPVGAGGVVDLFNGAGSGTQLVADVVGYVDTIGGDARGGFGPLTPARLLDTRIGLGASGALAPGATVELPVVGHGGVSADSNGFGYSAAVLNIAAIDPVVGGYVTVWADDQPRPTTSNLNLTPGQVRANLVVAGLGSGGGVKIYNGSTHPLQLVGDIAGYFSGGSPNSTDQFATTGPTRVLDTRVSVGAVPPGATVVASIGPATPLSAAVLDVIATGATGSGYLTVYGHGLARPATSNLNFVAGDTTAGLSIVPLGTDHKVSIYNGSSGSVQVVVDESGYVTG